ncbi:MAG TPA: oligosaccharide flippase family protein [Smithella sp.]|nr:oligosaccharide flippase family protein [Smithella sp.]
MLILKNLKSFINNSHYLLKDQQSLLGRCVRSGGILAAGSLSENSLRFIRNIILARILVPDAFGLMATIMAIVAASEAFAEVGLTQSIIQNKNGADKEFLNVIWWFSAFRGIALYVIVFFAAPFIANFLNKPEAALILRIALIAIPLRGLTSPNIFLLQKDLKFRKWVILTQSAIILGILIAIMSSFYLRNVWALVLGYIAEAFSIFLFSYIFYPHIPKLQINLSHAKDIMSFSRKIFGLPMLMVLYMQMDNFVIGKVLSLSTLGLYALARDLADIPNKIFTRIMPVFLPAFSIVQDDKDILKTSLLKLTEIIATFVLPFLTFYVVFSKPVLALVYSSVYSKVAIPFSIMCGYVFLYILSSLIMNVVFATGNPDKYRTPSLVRTIIFLIILYPAAKYFGLIGVSLSALFSMCLAFVIQIHYLKSLLNISIIEYVRCVLKGIKSSLIVFIPGFFFVSFFSLPKLSAVAAGALFCIIAWCFGILTFIHHKET